jgi:hypothetical protein
MDAADRCYIKRLFWAALNVRELSDIRQMTALPRLTCGYFRRVWPVKGSGRPIICAGLPSTVIGLIRLVTSAFRTIAPRLR